MAKAESDKRVQLSLLDRLVDMDPELERDPPLSRTQALRELRQSVRRDLEHLLNGRQRCRSWPRSLTELDRSLLNYGIPDFTGVELGASGRREDFRSAVERVIREFEPRFTMVRVSLIEDENDEQLDRTMRFRIEALMRVEPAPEPIVFDSQLEPLTNTFSLSERRDG